MFFQLLMCVCFTKMRYTVLFHYLLIYLRFSNFPCQHTSILCNTSFIFKSHNMLPKRPLFICPNHSPIQDSASHLVIMSFKPLDLAWSSTVPLFFFFFKNLLVKETQPAVPHSEFVCLPPSCAVYLVLQPLNYKSES